MTTTLTTKRRLTRATREARGTVVKSGALVDETQDARRDEVMWRRCLSALRELMLRRVPRSCGGFSADDIGCEMRTMVDLSEVLSELESAGMIRFCGWDDVEGDGVSCYALCAAADVVGMLPGGTRYGPHGLVALEAVGYPVRRGPVDIDQWLWDRYQRLTDLGDAAWAAGGRGVAIEMGRRAIDVMRQINERRRRWMEGYVRDGGPGWTCRSLVVVGEIGDVADPTGLRMEGRARA